MIARLTLILLNLVALGAFSLPAMATSWQQFAPAQQVLNGNTPGTQGLQLDLPLVSEDGSAVPLSVKFTGHLAADDSLASIRIFATGNPRAEVIDFLFQDASALADISTRIRLNESQTVIALATSRSGKHWVAERDVRVTVSGCLMRSDEQADGGMQNPRIALPRRIQKGQAFEVRTLLNHPMETGLREGSDGKLLPQNLVHSLQVQLGDKPVFETRFHSGTSANPYVRFNLNTQNSATARFIWTDQQDRQLVEQRDLSLN